VSVLPKHLITDTISLPDEAHTKRHVKVFGGEEIVLDGPILLDIIICGVHIVYPFFYVDAEIPAIGGYDLLRAAHIIIDTQSAEVWSKHPDVVNQSFISENVFATVQPQFLPNGMTPSSTSQPAPVSSVTSDTTSGIQRDTRPAATDNWSYSTFPPTFCVTEDTSSLAIGTAPHTLNTFAPSFDPPSLRGAKWFATLDLLSWYWQLGMTSVPAADYFNFAGCHLDCVEPLQLFVG